MSSTLNRLLATAGLALALLVVAGLAGCSSTYYTAMEKIGFAKREILVDRVDKARTTQTEAKQQFVSALAHFLAVTKTEGGDLQKKYDDLNHELTRSETRAKEVRERISSVEDVAGALFTEWKDELAKYSNAALRADSERQLEATRKRYDDLLKLMHRAADRMEPVLGRFRDQVLYLKHNLNARALASLNSTHLELEADISSLIADMEASIRESETFVKGMKQKA